MTDRRTAPTDYATRAAHYRHQALGYRATGEAELAIQCETFADRCDQLAHTNQGMPNRCGWSMIVPLEAKPVVTE